MEGDEEPCKETWTNHCVTSENPGGFSRAPLGAAVRSRDSMAKRALGRSGWKKNIQRMLLFYLNYISRFSFTSVFLPSVTPSRRLYFPSDPQSSAGMRAAALGGGQPSFHGQAFSAGGAGVRRARQSRKSLSDFVLPLFHLLLSLFPVSLWDCTLCSLSFSPVAV